jgi:deazaflavin-dependent oxidoreductase (nitroreductase family)
MRTEHIQNVQSVRDDVAIASGPRSQPRPQSQPQSRPEPPSLPNVPPALSKVSGLARYVNPLVLRLAGTRLLPLYGVIEHRGRSSGKAYRTPVVVQPTSDGFIVPMPWGERSDWYRNVRAAGECVIRWKGRKYRMVQPELIAPAIARHKFGIFAQAFVKVFRVKHFLHLHLRN